MVRGKTKSGFEYELEDGILDDYEFFEMLCEIDGGNSSLMVTMINKLLGEEQKNRLKEHVRSKEGKVSVQRLFEEISEILSSSDEGKNC